MTDAEWNEIVHEWEKVMQGLGTTAFDKVVNALREGRRYRGILEMLAPTSSLARAALMGTTQRICCYCGINENDLRAKHIPGCPQHEFVSSGPRVAFKVEPL